MTCRFTKALCLRSAILLLLLSASSLFCQDLPSSPGGIVPSDTENVESNKEEEVTETTGSQGLSLWDACLHRLRNLEALDYFTLSVNLLLLLLSGPMADKYRRVRDADRSRVRLRILHFLNLSLFLSYLIALCLDVHVAKQFSQSFLVIMATFLLIHFMEAFLLSKFGQQMEIEGFARNMETNTSKTLELFTTILILLIAAVLLINLWELKGWLEKTSVLGFIALFCFATKEYWVGDFLSGIFIIGQGRIKRGEVIRIPQEDVFGIVLQVKGLQTIIRDLVRRHDITLPNTILLKNRVDILRTDLERGVRDFIDFKIGYGIEANRVEAYLNEVWNNACDTAAIDKKQSLHIALKDCGDHAATWRLSYTIKSPHQVILCQNAVREAAYDLQDKHGIEVSTPLTHKVLGDSQREKLAD
jgi:hypothetical protein